jgi:hypothetical protein
MTIYSKPTDMKIVVSQSSNGKPDGFTIQVWDSGRMIDSRDVEGLIERDRIVWELADLYDALDIEVREKSKPKPEAFRFSEIPSIPVLDEKDASAYFEENEQYIYDRMLIAVEEGMITKRPFIRLFELNGTGVYITSIRSSWKIGLEQALEFYLETENYEKCAVIKTLTNKL